jgi:subfamily B ATP-binding cassette protein MsbA
MGRLIVAVIAGAIYGASTGFGIPKIIQHVYPYVFGGEVLASTSLAVLVAFLPLLVAMIRSGACFVNGYYLSYCGQFILEKIRFDTFSRLQTLPISYFRKHSLGDLIARLTNDTLVLQTVLTEFAQEVLRQPATLVATLVAVGTICLKRTDIFFLLIVLVAIPLTVFPVRYIGGRLRNKSRLLQDQGGVVASRLAQNLSAIQEIRAFGLEEYEKNRYAEACKLYMQRVLRTVAYGLFLSPAIEVIAAFGICGALYYAWTQKIPAEDLIAILLALYFSYEPLKKIGRLHNRLKEASASLDRLEEILHAPETIPEPQDPLPFCAFEGAITFENVSFAYQEAKVLNQINLKLSAKKTYALVGPSGAGKTTFTQLIHRFYDPSEGCIKIDGIDIKNMRIKDLRSQIALVPQMPVLFQDTIFNNILMGNLNASPEQVYEAARQAQAEDFILRLPEGYQTFLGENGAGLSGGQRQRLAIARAFLRQAPILILDEATSALDSESEHSIQLALEKLFENRTVLLIAHRFSSIRYADEILVFQQGQITERGTHATLMETQTLYRKMFETQQL